MSAFATNLPIGYPVPLKWSTDVKNKVKILIGILIARPNFIRLEVVRPNFIRPKVVRPNFIRPKVVRPKISRPKVKCPIFTFVHLLVKIENLSKDQMIRHPKLQSIKK